MNNKIENIRKELERVKNEFAENRRDIAELKKEYLEKLRPLKEKEEDLWSLRSFLETQLLFEP